MHRYVLNLIVFMFFAQLALANHEDYHGNEDGTTATDAQLTEALTQVANQAYPYPVEPVANLSAQVAEGVKVTIISDIVTGWDAIGDWGFSAFVEIKTNKGMRYILFDTGNESAIFMRNLQVLIDAKQIPDLSKFTNREVEVVLSHWHGDHTAGFLELKHTFPNAIGKIHVAPDFFTPRYKKNSEGQFESASFPPTQIKNEYIKAYSLEQFESDFVIHQNFSSIWQDIPGVWITGPVERVTNETNYPRNKFFVKVGENFVEDQVPDDMALTINARDRGLVVITGCGHAGIINILRHAEKNTGVRQVHAVIGGLHLRTGDVDAIAQTSLALRHHNIQYLLGAHCTGMHRILAFANFLTGLSKDTAIISSTESVYKSTGNYHILYPGESINQPLSWLTDKIPAEAELALENWLQQ